MLHTKRNYYLRRGLLILVLFITIITISCIQQKRESTYSPASSTSLNIPAVTGLLTIDGKLDDPVWQSARTLPLTNREIDNFGQGGEARIAVRGSYLCLSARVPESNRLVAHSTGINPTWWREDVIVWRLRYQSPITHLNMSVMLAANPLGAFSLYAGGNWSMGDVINSTGIPLKWASDVLAAAVIGQTE